MKRVIYKGALVLLGCMFVVIGAQDRHTKQHRAENTDAAHHAVVSQYAYDYSLLSAKKRKSQTRSSVSQKERPYGPSDATMRQSVLGGGYLSGGQFSCSMGAGATRGHGHR